MKQKPKKNYLVNVVDKAGYIVREATHLEHLFSCLPLVVRLIMRCVIESETMYDCYAADIYLYCL